MRQGRETLRVYAIVTAVAAAVLYGSSYQQFRFFSLSQPGGAADAVDYVAMARGDIATPLNLHNYRWITPVLAGGVNALLAPLPDPDLSLRLSFYIVNFGFSLAATMMLFAALRALSFAELPAAVGACLFASSRVVALVTGTPMADAVFFCAIAALTYLMAANRPALLAWLLPALALSKDIFLPFVFVPLLTDLRRSKAVLAAIPIAAMAFPVSMYLVEQYYGRAGTSMIATFHEHSAQVGEHTRYLFSSTGLADLQSGFSLTLALAIAGAWLNAERRTHHVPHALIAMLPIAIGLVLLSGNAGRMLFAAFPVVIAYAVIPIELLLDPRVTTR